MKDFRSRIYKNYVSARVQKLAPESINGLNSRAPYIKRIIQRHFPRDQDAKIVDLGCGHGAIIYFAQKAGYRQITGIDGSPEQVAVARNLGIKGVQEGDLIQGLSNIKDGSLDAVITFDVIEHFTREELMIFVDEVFRVLKPQAKWIIHTPNGESPFSGRIRYSDITHELSFTRISIAQLLFASGFTEVRTYEDEPVPHGLKSLIRMLLWKSIRMMLRFYIATETGDTAQDAIFTQNFLTIAIK